LFPDGLAGEADYGMEIVQFRQDDSGMSITTTGAIYRLSPQKIEMIRRIDPQTNTLNPRLVAQIDFDQSIFPLTLTQLTKRRCEIKGQGLNLSFRSDSLFFLENTAETSLRYRHQNLIENAPWDKEFNHSRMWTDGYGGSLYSRALGTITTEMESDSTQIQLQPQAQMAHMVFPSKPFDFDFLYGPLARPFVQFFYSNASLPTRSDQLRHYLDNHFGVFVLFGGVYTNTERGEMPVTLPSGILGYEYSDPTAITNFVRLAHENGFKVITYFQAGFFNPNNSGQSPSTTYRYMQEFQNRYQLDGWYFDNAAFGGTNMLENYNFMKQVRADVGDEGILYHHDSVDVVGRWTGFRALMINNYVNYTLTGETHQGPARSDTANAIDDPLNPYLRFFTAAYGFSQAFAAHKRATLGIPAITIDEKNRVVGENLIGVGRNGESPPLGYAQRKEAYQAGRLRRDISWPPLWFQPAQNINVTQSNSSVTISWETPTLATTELSYTPNEIWWNNPSFENLTQNYTDNQLTFFHSVTLEDLPPNQPFEFRIRSRNGLLGLEEMIWGYVGEFTSTSI
jgi:hypothetical protein